MCSRGYFLKASALRELDELDEAINLLKTAPEKIRDDKTITTLLKELEEEHALDNKFPSDHSEIVKFNKFMKWLHDGGAVLENIKLRYNSVNYRSVHAKVKLKRDEVLLYVPKDLIISLEDARKSPMGVKIEKENINLFSPKHTMMAIYLLQEMHNPESKWKPYIDVLPQSTSNFPIFFTEEELSWLEGSPFLSQVKNKINDIAWDYKQIVNKIPDFAKYDVKEFSHARMLISSRVFGVTLEGKLSDILVPVADMFNYGCPQQVSWEYKEEHKGFFVGARESVARGAELYEAYGRKCNTRYFLNYGFVLEGNTDNEVPILLDLNKIDPLYAIKMKIVDYWSSKIIRVPEDFNHRNVMDFFSYLRFIEYEGDTMYLYKFLFQNTSARNDRENDFYETYHGTYYPPSSIKNETAVLNKMIAVAEELLNKYPNTYEEDIKLLESNKDLTYNQRNCVLMRSGEKKILLKLIELAEFGLELMKMPLKKAKAHYQKKENKDTYEKYVTEMLFPLLQSNK